MKQKQTHPRWLKPVMEFKDIAEELGLSEQCVQRTCKKALRKLSKTRLAKDMHHG